MENLELLYEGKAKKVYTTVDPDILIVDYKDDASAFNGLKKGTIAGKGVINNRMTNFLLHKLEEKNVPTDLLEELGDRESAVKKADVIPLEVIIRNVAAGSITKKLAIKEGTMLNCPTLEFNYKNDDLGDPFINSYYALSLGYATQDELHHISEYAFQVNKVLTEYFKTIGIRLVDMKLEFGRYKGQIILVDEISPDTCRLWDVETGEKLDKDRFRRDLGKVEDAYREVFQRLKID